MARERGASRLRAATAAAIMLVVTGATALLKNLRPGTECSGESWRSETNDLSRTVVPPCAMNRHRSLVKKEREWSALVAAELGHEMRNVLSVIQSLGSLLRDELPPAGDAIELVDDLLLTCERAERLSQRLMQLARDTFHGGPADLVAVVSRLATTLQRVAPQGITIALEASEGPLWTSLPTLDIEQVLFNLAHNAFDAMSDHGVLAIRVSATRKAAVLAVGDTGVGMDEDTVQRCFEPFFTTKAERGTGIGLHAVREAVERAGGRVIAESAPGHGTTLSVYLPLLDRGAAS
jgi:signal transduction histidine kinase